MLHTESIESGTLEALRRLMCDEALRDFSLVGGTALALYMGHRRSIDLDLFTLRPFDAPQLRAHLADKYGLSNAFVRESTVKGTIDRIKIDCITYAYPLLEPVHEADGLRLCSLRDIAAMKLSAIADSGTRLKDFVDVACLSTRLSLGDMLRAYDAKYRGMNPISPLKALTYYDDIREREPILTLRGSYDWALIDARLRSMLDNMERIYEVYPFAFD